MRKSSPSWLALKLCAHLWCANTNEEKKAPLLVELKKGFARKAVRIPFAWSENEKKTFEEDGAEAPKLLCGGIHLWMRAFPSACHRLSAPIHGIGHPLQKRKRPSIFEGWKKASPEKLSRPSDNIFLRSRIIELEKAVWTSEIILKFSNSW